MQRPRGNRILLLTASASVLLLAGSLALRGPRAGRGDPHECRFWGLIGRGYPEQMINAQLWAGPGVTLRQLGWSNPDGWGLAAFLGDTCAIHLSAPLVRRGRPSAGDSFDPRFEEAVAELGGLRPAAAVGHVRNASSGHTGLPDPHPFVREGLAFAHNGDIPEDLLVRLLTSDDPGYLERNPPDYVSGYIDSELYFLYLLKYIHRHPVLGRPEALRRAAQELSRLAPGSRLNFVLTSADTLYALRCYDYDMGDPVCFFPGNTGGERDGSGGAGTSALSRYWVVASQPLGPEPERWAPIPASTLAMFVPGRGARFFALEPPDGMSPVPIGRLEKEGFGPDPTPVRPNPSRGMVEIPLGPAPERAAVSVEVWDAAGRMIWRSASLRAGPGGGSLVWREVDQRGDPVASGTYFCVVRSGDQQWRRRITVVR